MTATPTPRTRSGAASAVLAAVALMALVAHGCHGDDVDHEPLAAPRITLPEEHVSP